MLDLIINFDKDLFYFLNSTIANPVFDTIMPIITKGRYWMPIYILLFLYLIFFNHLKILKNEGIKLNSNYFKNLIKYNKVGFAIAILLALSVILADQISANFIKDIVGRLRPCRELDNINLLVHCGSGKSFPSAHATNNFAAAVILSHFFHKNRYYFFSIATIVALSRVFVGVHYPIDITAGAILGVALSSTLLFIFNKFIIDRLK